MIALLDRPSAHYSARRGHGVKWLVVHSTASAPEAGPENTGRFLQQNTRGVSVHEYIAPGEVWRMVPDNYAAHHAETLSVVWPDRTPWSLSNEVSWGAELYQVRGQAVPRAVANAAVVRFARACERLGLGVDRILFHRNIDPSRRSDPVGLDLEHFRSAVAHELSGESGQVPDGLALALRYGAAQAIRVPINPGAALLAHAAGTCRPEGWPSGEEFVVDYEGQRYVAQVYTRSSDAVGLINFAPWGQWDDVRWIPERRLDP